MCVYVTNTQCSASGHHSSGRFLITLLFTSSFLLPQLVLQGLVLIVTLLILLLFFLFSPQRKKKGTARPHHLLLFLRICIKQIRVLLHVSRLANINTNSILKVVILKVFIYGYAVLYRVL